MLSFPLGSSFPIFGDVEGPLEFQVCMMIIVNELGDSFVVASGEHARRSLLRSEFRHIYWLVGGVGWIASNHLLVLAHSNSLALESLNVFQTRQDFVLNNEGGLHLVSATFLDGEWLFFERLNSARGGKIYCDVWPAFDFLEQRQLRACAVTWTAYQC